MKTFICKMCGKEFESSANRADYCPECRAERQRIRSREYSSRAGSGETRTIGQTDICKVCGKPYIVKSGSQKVCEDCRKQYTNKKKSVSNAKYSAKAYDTASVYLKKGEKERLKNLISKNDISMNEFIRVGLLLAEKQYRIEFSRQLNRSLTENLLINKTIKLMSERISEIKEPLPPAPIFTEDDLPF